MRFGAMMLEGGVDSQTGVNLSDAEAEHFKTEITLLTLVLW